MRNLLTVCLLLALLSLTVIPVAAQDTRADLIEELQTATDQFTSVGSYRTSAVNTIEQNIALTVQDNPMDVVQNISQTLDGVYVQTGDLPSVQVTVDQEIDSNAMGSATIDQTIEMVLVDGDFYIRFSGDATPGAGNLLPSDWVNVADAQDEYPGLQFLSSDQFSSMLGGQVTFPITDEIVIDIEALPNETLDSGEARVIHVTLDGAALMQSKAAQAVLGASGLDQMLGQVGGDAQAMITDLFDDAVMDYVYYINVADGLIHQVVSHLEMNADLSIMGTDVTIDQVVDSTMSFTDFGESFDIQTPDITETK